MTMIEVINLPRRGGKTTKALELLKSSEKNIMFIHTGIVIDHPLIEEYPYLKNRIFTTYDYKIRLRGKVLETVIIDNADLLDKDLLLDMLHHFTSFPYGMNGLCKIVLTMSPVTIKTHVKQNHFDQMHDIVMDMFTYSCQVLKDEELDDHDFKFCADMIIHTLNYLKNKRKE